MREYFLIWRALPKFCIGIAFAVELLVAVFGRRRLESLLEASKQSFTSHLSGATLLVALVIVLVVVAGIGLFLLDVLLGLIRRAAKMASLSLPKSWAVPIAFKDLFSNPYTIALRIFKDRGTFYLDFISLKSTAMGVETLDKSSEIRSLAKLVSLHIMSARSSDIESINFYGLLGQERRAVEIILDDIQMLESLIVVLLLTPIVLWPIFDMPAELLSIFIAIGVGLVLVPEILDKKLFLGGVLLAGYLDSFVVDEGADIADREGELVL
jgi:hypothetical protein